jgi:1,4-alpha-glucan branching enzyme
MWAHPGKKLLFMGQEWAQNDEWSQEAGLQWHLTEFDEHKGVQKAVADINKSYKSLAPLWEKDISADGFQWIVGDDGAGNTLAFTRWSDKGIPVVCITNFSPVPHEQYRLRLPVSGVWREVLNTDDLKYGGSGVTNNSFAVDVDTDLYTVLRVPPLATIWLERV